MRKHLIILSSIAILMGNQQFVGAEPDHEKGRAGVLEVGNKICPVSGDQIPARGEDSAMGEPAQYEYDGKIYNLCCSMCESDFKKDPERYSNIAEEEIQTKK